MPKRRIAVIGAGPGGLTAALSAAKLGYEVTLFEQSEQLKGPGGSWVINPNGLQVLEALELKSELASCLQPISKLTLENPQGKTLVEARYDCAAAACIEVLEKLFAACEKNGVKILLGHKLTELKPQSDCSGLQFANGFQANTEILVGADGIHSQIRKCSNLQARLDELTHAYVKGVLPLAPRYLASRDIWTSDGRRFGIDPLPGGRCGFYASIPRHANLQELRGQTISQWIGSWADCGSDVRAVLDAVESWAAVVYDRPYTAHVARWTSDRSVLVGDAAHAQAPNLGQGANSAMVDALVFTRLLAKLDDPKLAGKEYQRIRSKFVSRTQAFASILSFLESSTKPASDLRNFVFMLGARSHLAEPIALRYLKGQNSLELDLLK